MLSYHTRQKKATPETKPVVSGQSAAKIKEALNKSARSAHSRRRFIQSFLRVYLKTVNTPKQRVFSACCAPFSLAIHKVFPRENGFIRRKIPRCWSYCRFSDRP